VRIYKVEDTMLETENFRLQRGIIKQSRWYRGTGLTEIAPVNLWWCGGS
jgi:hypothetical protein